MTGQLHRRIVVGTDGTVGSLAAVDFGVTEARLRNLPLHLVAVHPTAEPDQPHTALPAILHRVCETWPELPVTGREVTGDPVGVLADISRTAALVVVGRRQAHGAGPAPAAAVAARTAAHTLCPTVVVPADAAEQPGTPVLVGVGMTPDDEAPLGFAFDAAARRGVPVRAVHVWSGIPTGAVGSVSPFAYDLGQAQAAADRELAEAVRPWAEKYREVAVEQMALYDVNPVRTLLDASALAGLMVVGAHRFPAHSSQVLGGAAHALVQRGHRPVAVIRPGHTG